MRLVATKTSNGRADESPDRPWKGGGNSDKLSDQTRGIKRTLRVD